MKINSHVKTVIILSGYEYLSGTVKNIVIDLCAAKCNCGNFFQIVFVNPYTFRNSFN